MRVGVIGLGFMGLTHLKALSSTSATLAAVSSADPTKLAGDLRDVGGNLGVAGQRFDFSNILKFSDWRDLIASPHIDAVDICTPTYLHHEMTLAALRAGKHVLVEKPIALTGEAADQLVAEASASGRILMAAHVLRFFPNYSALKHAQLGPPLAAAFRRRCAAPNWSRWLLDPSRSGGGVFDLLIHDIDFNLHLFGPPDDVSASGAFDPNRGVDTIAATLHYPNHTSTVTGGWYHPAAMPWSADFSVTFERGTLEWSSSGTPLTLYSESGESLPQPLPDLDGYTEEIRYFLRCAQDNHQPDLCPPAESAQAVKLAHLIVQARTRNGDKIPCRI
jgi:predicted dehydrogenase